MCLHRCIASAAAVMPASQLRPCVMMEQAPDPSSPHQPTTIYLTAGSENSSALSTTITTVPNENSLSSSSVFDGRSMSTKVNSFVSPNQNRQNRSPQYHVHRNVCVEIRFGWSHVSVERLLPKKGNMTFPSHGGVPVL